MISKIFFNEINVFNSSFPWSLSYIFDISNKFLRLLSFDLINSIILIFFIYNFSPRYEFIACLVIADWISNILNFTMSNIGFLFPIFRTKCICKRWIYLLGWTVHSVPQVCSMKKKERKAGRPQECWKIDSFLHQSLWICQIGLGVSNLYPA